MRDLYSWLAPKADSKKRRVLDRLLAAGEEGRYTRMAYRIRLKGKTQEDLILVGSLKRGGLITTLARHQDRQLCLAILNPDGSIVRLKKQIGTRDDIGLGERLRAPQRKAEPFEEICERLDIMADGPPPIPEIV